MELWPIGQAESCNLSQRGSTPRGSSIGVSSNERCGPLKPCDVGSSPTAPANLNLYYDRPMPQSVRIVAKGGIHVNGAVLFGHSMTTMDVTENV